MIASAVIIMMTIYRLVPTALTAVGMMGIMRARITITTRTMTMPTILMISMMTFDSLLELFGGDKEQCDDYRERCLAFREETLACVSLLTDVGKFILDSFKNKEIPRYLVYCYDMIKRIRENLSFLTIFHPLKDNSIPLRLILRSVFTDLISLSYVVENFDNIENVSNFMAMNDIKAIDGKKSFAECEREFITLCGKDDWNGVFDKAINDFVQVKDEIISPYGSKSQLKSKTKTETKDIADYFKGDSKLSPLYALLYGPFKMLSQVEHYANENRSYSYFNTNLGFFFQKFSLHYKIVIQNICSQIKNHIDSNYCNV